MILLDTHVVLWSVNDDARLGSKTRQMIGETSKLEPFYVSAITTWEIAMLVKKGRLDLGQPADDWLGLASRHPAWQNLAIDPSVAIDAVNLPGNFHNDPADRFIVAAARLNRFSVVTADRAILDYARAGFVKAIDALN
jgi:PIN domain nuclease of toxin-antitoxin system